MSGAATQAAPTTTVGGTQRIPLTMESYQHPSVPLSSKLLLNMFIEQAPGDARVAQALLPWPGYAEFLSVGTGPIYALDDSQPGVVYLVSGTHFWMVERGADDTWAATDLGDVGTPSGGFGPDYLFYTIAVGPTAAVVCSPPNAYVSAGGTPVAQITTTWPAYGASSVTYLDGYFVFTGQGDPHFFFITTLGDPTLVDALDFAALDAFPNAITKVLTVGTDLWFGGASGWEIWYDAGNADFPMRRRPNGFLQRSVGAPKSIARGDESLFWYSADGRVYRTVGYQEKRISTHAIEAQLPGNIVNAYIHNHIGHIFFVLNLIDRTLVYDVATGVWHNASSQADGSGPWRGSCATQNVAGFPLVGDSTAGRLIRADPAVTTDMGVAVRHQIVLPPLYAGTKRAFIARLEIEMEVGSLRAPDAIVLEWSDDGGFTWNGFREMQLGRGNLQYRKRVYTTRLGSFRNRVFRLTSVLPFTVFAVDCDITVGAS